MFSLPRRLLSSGRVAIGTPKRRLESAPAITLVRVPLPAPLAVAFRAPGVPMPARGPLPQTDAARARITSLLEKKPEALGVRLGVRTRTCATCRAWRLRSVSVCVSRRRLQRHVIHTELR